MICVSSEDGQLVKMISLSGQSTFGWHPTFGFCSEQSALQRRRARKRHGLKSGKEDWICRFSLSEKGEQWELQTIEGCQATATEGGYLLRTPLGQFRVGSEPAMIAPVSRTVPETTTIFWRSNGILVGAIALAFLFSLLGTVEEEEEEKEEKLTVKVVNQHRVSVQLPKPKVQKILSPEEIQAKKQKRFMNQNLGFLKMMGSRKLNKLTQGNPTKLNASAGVGPGGDEGSGGEFLVGLGKGLTRTTVGNTGVKGLGGVGTKGVGGGAGGYGESLVGAQALAARSITSDIILDGGLDASVIRATIAKYLNQVRACYEGGLKDNPGLNGQVTMAFEIGGKGRLNYAKVSNSSLGSNLVEDCIASKMLSWKFPMPVGGVNVKVKYPFLLRPVRS